MSHRVYIAASPGLVLGDFALRLYRACVQQTLPSLSFQETPGAEASVYAIDGAPDGSPGDDLALTWRTGTTTGLESWQLPRVRTKIVLPLRQDGVVLSDLTIELVVDGEEVSTAALVLTAIGGSPSDYVLAGLPVATGVLSVALMVGFGGVYQVYQWPLSASPRPVPPGGPGASIMAEIVAAAEETFRQCGDLARLTLRRYRKGITSGAVISGVQARLPIGSPVLVTGIVGRRSGRRTGATAEVLVRAADLADAGLELGNPRDEWTVQEPNGIELELSGPWRAFGPEPGNPALWRGTISSGTEAPGV